jgi:hypothetical protein
MSNDGKKPVWVSTEAHDFLKDYCDRTGRTQVDVVSDLLVRFVEPEIKAVKAAGKGD